MNEHPNFAGAEAARRRPAAEEAAPYFFRYIDQVPGADALASLAAQELELNALLGSLTEERSRHRYAPGKWTVKGVLAHVNDGERLFTFRALWFARGLEGALPSFDETVAAAADARSWASHVAEFRALRAATRSLFEGLPAEAWDRRGIASGNPFSVRALAFVTAGHAAHHATILRERYLA
jgi:hypothetical protein